jgi:hypothetical protein
MYGIIGMGEKPGEKKIVFPVLVSLVREVA